MASSRFDGQTCIVTGGAQGIGRAVALRLALEGGTVVVARAVDLLDREAVRDGIDEVVATYGHLDVLVNNVGGATAIKPFWEFGQEELLTEVARSLEPTLWCCHAAIRHLRGRGGAIVNLGSTSPRGIYRVPYAVAKGGVFALTTSLALELANDGVRVNCVAPGATRITDRVTPRPGFDGADPDGYRQELEAFFDRQIPMGRWGTVDEVAAAVVFLASSDAGFTTGHILPVAGGATVP